MLDDRRINLCKYRINNCEDSLKVAQTCVNEKLYKDSINRSYYAAFYAIKAVLALEGIDFKRHKDVIAYFNKNYVASEMFPKEFGRKIARLQQKREQSDYDDFYIASKEEANMQLNHAEETIIAIKEYLSKINILG